MEHDMPPVKIEVEFNTSPQSVPRAPLSPALRERLEKRSLYSRQEAVEDKLLRAQRARQEMRMAAEAKRRTFVRRVPRSSDNNAVKLQARLDSATSAHLARLEERRSKARRFLSRRAGAVARAAMHREERLERLHEQQLHEEIVVDRRYVLQQLKREKLRQQHGWVQSRLVMHRVNSLSLESQRLLLDERLSLARQLRSMQLDVRAARAGNEVSRARSMRLAAQVHAKERAEATRARLQEKLQAAEERRQAILATVKLPARNVTSAV